MKKQLLKSALVAVAGVGLMAGNALAVPYAQGPWTDYEYYQKTTLDSNGHAGQYLQNGDSVNFFFDLAFLGLSDSPYVTGTDSQLSLMYDVEEYGSLYTYPIADIWTAITILSTDQDWEQFSVNVTAYLNDETYHLTDRAFTLGSGGNSTIETVIIKWDGDLLDTWKIDPYGIVTLELKTFFDFGGYNDFNLIEVGLGVSTGTDPGVVPVPEPTTMLLFGSGLLGLAAIARRRRS